MNEIKKTKDYNIFKTLEGNRNIDKYHLKKLKSSVQKNNQLNLHPIIVNENNEVIDGQHRLEVAKDLDLDIYFIKSETVNAEHLIECNANQKTWEMEDYISYFSVKEKISDYIILHNLLKKTKINPKALLNLILSSTTRDILEFLKTGRFRLPIDKDYENCLDFYLDFVSYTQDKKITPTSMFRNYYFTKAFRWLFKTTGFQKELFFSKLDLKWFELKPQKSSENWYKILIGIYNFKNHSRIMEEYGEALQSMESRR